MSIDATIENSNESISANINNTVTNISFIVEKFKGEVGTSAYQAWLDSGNNGTKQEFLNSIIPTEEINELVQNAKKYETDSANNAEISSVAANNAQLAASEASNAAAAAAESASLAESIVNIDFSVFARKTDITAINSSLSNKVEKINGKSLTSNDFTDDLLIKLNSIDSGANNYSLPMATSDSFGGVKIGGGITVINGVISADIPTLTSLGLNNVDNTSDLNKPISAATQTALNAKVDTSLIANTASHVPKYNSDGHLVLPSGAEIW